MKRSFVTAGILAALPAFVFKADALEKISRDPFISAIVVDADSGDVLFARHANQPIYPASVLKLMDLLLVLEEVDAGTISLSTPVAVSAAAAGMGGSQVYLKEGEVFTIEALLYAIMIQSANDAALALAEAVSGSKQAFVAKMNERARAIGMTDTEFHSVHGLPPGKGQKPDVSTARDIALLALEVLKHPEAARFMSTKERGFRDNTFIMRTHNYLLTHYEGCDGLKTGYYRAAGFSIAATAERNGKRAVAVVMGSESKKARNQAAMDFLNRAFLILE